MLFVRVAFLRFNFGFRRVKFIGVVLYFFLQLLVLIVGQHDRLKDFCLFGLFELHLDLYVGGEDGCLQLFLHLSVLENCLGDEAYKILANYVFGC